MTQIDIPLARALIDSQFPQWRGLAIADVAHRGWDNRTFRLGERMLVRLPSGAHYAPQVEKEQRWLPVLTPHLPLAIPQPLARGEPGAGYPWPWSVYGWIEGEHAEASRIADLPAFAVDLAGFLSALQRVGTAGAPPAGPHSFQRGAHLSAYDAETRRCIAETAEDVDAAAATALWEAAICTAWDRAPVWLHGDVAPGNLLVRDGHLSAVIDFGCCAIGDPACDLAISWTFLDDASRGAFRAALPLDRPTWLRGRGWALWKALLMLTWHRGTDPEQAMEDRRVIRAVLDDRG